MSQAAPPDPPTVHGMLIVGENTVYLSHLSMFPPSPHRYQAIFEVALPQQAIYSSDRRSHPNVTIYTIKPKPFILHSLNPADKRTKTSTSFPVDTIERGHFERPPNSQIVPNPNLLISGGQAQVKRVLHFREYAANAPKLPQLRYLLFGKGNEMFLAHFITAAPDFDHVLSVRTLTPPLSEAELNGGVVVEFPARANSIDQRLVDSLTANAVLVPVAAIGANPPRQLKVATGKTLYLEEGELKVKPEFTPTPTERQAGFAP